MHRIGWLASRPVRSACVFASLLAGACGAGRGGDAETGDLPVLRERGEIRILVPALEPLSLSRRGYSLDFERGLAEQFVRDLGLAPRVVAVPQRDRMIEMLVHGQGDVVVARLTVTEERQQRVAFSVPLEYVREVLVCRADDPSISRPEDLGGKRVAVRSSSSYYETLRELQRKVPGLQIVTVPEEWDTEEILYRVSRGEYDATAADEDIFREARAYLDNLRSPFALTGERPVAWALRKGNVLLKQAVDQFLHEQALTQDLETVLFGDLDLIRQRRVLRILTTNTAATYFLYRGEPLGFEYEFARRFARSIGCRIRIVVPPRPEQLIDWLLQGRGDLVAAAMTVTPERQKRVAFTRPYHKASEIVVTRAADEGPQGLEDLEGRTVAVRRSSAYYETLVELRPHYGFEILEVPEELTTENIIAEVAAGRYDLTVAGSNILDIELTYRDDVRGAFALGEPRDIAWMVRPEDHLLLEAANEYIEREYRGEFYNVLLHKYYRNPKGMARMVAERPVHQGRISPYDDLFRKYGRAIEVDWRLLAAQSYQESRFDPAAASWAGALGLMQVLPRTALALGVAGDLREPEVGIEAGARYLRWLIDSFEPSLPPGVRIRFALAAYNAGRGHVFDARRLARERGLDPDRWFDNVERAIPLLSHPSYADQSRFGYCRCAQTVEYVRQINERYRAYTRVID